MNGTDFNRTCESPSVVTLWAGAAVRQEKTLIHAPLLAYRWWWGFFWWAAWRGGKENPHRPYADGGMPKRSFEGVRSHLTPRINSCKPDANVACSISAFKVSNNPLESTFIAAEQI